MKETKNKLIPKIKKKVNAFLVGEEGKISKEAILKAGIISGGIAVSLLFVQGVQATHDNQTTHSNTWVPSHDSSHSNGLTLDYDQPGSRAWSTHASEHSSGGWCV
jgi:hypothetical protein